MPLTVKKEEAEPVKQEETSVKKEEEEAGPSGSAKAEDALGGKEEASVSIDPEDLLKVNPSPCPPCTTFLSPMPPLIPG